jgi:hypothetical protein
MTMVDHDSEVLAVDLVQVKPCWNCRTGELWLGGRLVKRIPSRATSERKVLDAFQKSEWADELENPLDCKLKDRAQHLFDAVRSLNTSQVEHLMEFASTSRGKAIAWRAVK